MSMSTKRIRIPAESIAEATELTDACQYWVHQRTQAQKMLELSEKNLLELNQRLKDMVIQNERFHNGHH